MTRSVEPLDHGAGGGYPRAIGYFKVVFKVVKAQSPCRVNALRPLHPKCTTPPPHFALTQAVENHRAVVEADGVPLLVNLASHYCEDIRVYAALAIARIASTRSALSSFPNR